MVDTFTVIAGEVCQCCLCQGCKGYPGGGLARDDDVVALDPATQVALGLGGAGVDFGAVHINQIAAAVRLGGEPTARCIAEFFNNFRVARGVCRKRGNTGSQRGNG